MILACRFPLQEEEEEVRSGERAQVGKQAGGQAGKASASDFILHCKRSKGLEEKKDF